MTKNVFNSLSHVSNKRPSELQERDYDHEIHLIDHTNGPLSRHQSLDETRSRTDLTIDQESTHEATGSRRHSIDGTYENRRQRGKRHKVKKEVEKKRWSKKWTEDRPAERAGQVVVTQVDCEGGTDITPTTSGALPVLTTNPPKDSSSTSSRGRPISKAQSTTASKHRQKQPECEEVIDILYENERGGFLCGIPLFSARALGAFDHAPWTNIAFKPSATSIHDAQPPDPEWEWAWPEWRVNHDPLAPKQDEDGWEYSFMFSKRCSWHGATWYNSFVRRRAWIRKRVKVLHGRETDEGHQLTADYFTIHSQRMRSLSPAGTRHRANSKTQSSGTQFKREEVVDRSDIRDINHLMAALRESRIDREKMEVIESFVQNGGDDLLYLGKRMKDVMGMFIFQASRRVLLAHLSKTLDDAVDWRKRKHEELVRSGVLSNEEQNEEEERAEKRINNLMVAIRAADKEVKRLEYWSDIKEIAEEGATKGAVDEDKGWGEEWTGLDFSGPKPVITEARQPGGDDQLAERNEGTYDGAQDGEDQSPTEVTKVAKGKGRENEARF